MQTLREYISHYPMRATHAQWAAFFGISQPFFSQLISGARFPSRKLMMRIEERTRGAVPVTVWFDLEAQSCGERGGTDNAA